ncbi:MAG: DNA polymerase Y family protein [Bradymonadales bacterium]|nr:DNA polymerase Y family protein [Bradymonadales bacterium]
MRVAFVLVPQFLYFSHLVEGGGVSRLDPAQQERVVLVEREGGRRRVVAASPRLRGLGIMPGMTVSAVRSRVGEVWAVPFDAVRAERECLRLAGLLLTAGPHLGVVGRGAYWLGADGWRLLGGEPALMARAGEAVRQGGYPHVRVGVADTLIAARSAAVLGWGSVPPGGDGSFLASLPLTVLPLEPSVQESLAVLDIRTVGAFAALPAGQIADRFGRETARVHRLARGEESRSFEEYRPPEEQRLEVEFQTPFEVMEPVLFVLQGGLPALIAPHAARGFGVQRLEIELDLVQGRFQREIQAADALTEPGRLLELCRAALGDVELASPIVGVRVSVTQVAPAVACQEHLWDHSRRQGIALEVTLTRLQSRLGTGAVRTPGAVRDSHLPESTGCWFPVEAGADPLPLSPLPLLRANERVPGEAAPFEGDRPLHRLGVSPVQGPGSPPPALRATSPGLHLGGGSLPPEASSPPPPGSVAEEGTTAAWRLFNPPAALMVELIAGIPGRVRYQGRWRAVRRLGGGQCIETGWWDRSVCREYWCAELDGGLAVSLYRDLEDRGWYLQAVLD